MFDKLIKSNKIMGIVALATFAIVAYVLVYKPWKANREAKQMTTTDQQ